MKINFEGGDLSSDAGLLLIKEFAVKVGLVKLIYHLFQTNDTAAFRLHIDPESLLQIIYQTIAAYFEDDCADELTVDPIFTAILGKEALASQPTISRFFNRMDESTLQQFDMIDRKMRDIIYAIRLKINKTLLALAEDKADDLRRATKDNMIDYAVTYGEFAYQAGSWSHPRRVVFKIEKPANQMVFMYTFIVTDMESEPYQVIQFYCGRGKMENFIKEGKDGFDFSAISSKAKHVNANRLQLHVLAYNLFNWFRRGRQMLRPVLLLEIHSSR